jgi:hypothetical protein
VSLLSFGSMAESQNIPQEEVPVPPRREYVWRSMDRGERSLAAVARRITLDLDMNLSRLHRLTRTNELSPHRCVGYVREEITLATTTVDSAVLAHDTPSPMEICSVCHEVVGHDEAFQCVCGDTSEHECVNLPPPCIHSRSSWITTYHQMSDVQAVEPQRLRWQSEEAFHLSAMPLQSQRFAERVNVPRLSH